MKQQSCDTLVIGAGICGISTAFHLLQQQPHAQVILVEAGQPMAFTSAQSGENYRNWWPHPVMTSFTDRSIELMQQIAIDSENQINMTRRGYVLATRSDTLDSLLAELQAGYRDAGSDAIRIHDGRGGASYQAALSADWTSAPDGVDVLTNRHMIRRHFPSYDERVKTLVHVRRAGSISGQQLGQYLLQQFRAAGGRYLNAEVCAIERHADLTIHFTDSTQTISAQNIVNAAGPFINDIAKMTGSRLAVRNTLQQKIAFEDTQRVIARDMPFSIDLDNQHIDWSSDEIALLNEDPIYARLTAEMPGAIHCRPDGGDRGSWVKLGWAFNDEPVAPTREPPLTDAYPEIVLRGAARLNPALKAYYGRLPRNSHHYGGYYTLTEENWPLIGATDIDGCFVVGAMSGFGTMAACAAGELCACWVSNADKPDYAPMLSPQRHQDTALMAQLLALSSRGIL